MPQTRRIDELSPDGVIVKVRWGDMVVGSSIFIPCIDTVTAKKQVKKIAAQKGWECKLATRVEDKNLGVRMWRVL